MSETRRTLELQLEAKRRGISSEPAEPAEVYSGWVKGLRDPVDALSQMLYEAVPDSVKESGDKLNNWIADKTGLLETIPEGGFSEQLRQQEDKYQAGRKAEGDEGVDWDRIGGNIVSTMAPGVGAAKLAAPATMMGKMALGAGTGAGYGALTPTHEENFWPAKAKQAGVSAAFGGAIPVAGAMAKGGAHYVDELIKPLYKSGIARDVKKFMIEHAGSEREQIITALQKARQMVPGNKPTSGQAIAQSNIPGKGFGGQFVKLENEVSRQPVTGRVLKDVYGQQASGREGVIKAIAGTDDDMARAISARTKATAPQYKHVEQSTKQVDVKPVVDKIDDILSKHKNEPDVTGPLTKLRGQLVSDAGFESNPQNLASMSKGIKKMMGSITPGGQKEFNVSALDSVKGLLDKQIGSSEKAFKVAQTLYRQKSRPINQMNVGKELEKSLVDALEREKPSTFAGAVRNAPRTLKRSTGFNRYDKLEDVLSKQQAKSVRNVSDELANQAKAKAMATETGSILKDLPGEVTLSLPHILSRPIVVANHVLGMIGKDKTPQYKEMIASILKDPKKFEEALTLPAESAKRKMAADILQQLTIFSSVKSEQQGAN